MNKNINITYKTKIINFDFELKKINKENLNLFLNNVYSSLFII